MLRQRSLVSSTNTSRLKERHFKVVLKGSGAWLKKIVILLLATIFIYFFFKLFVVNEVVCTTNNRVCTNDVENILTYLKGKNVIFINHKKLNETIKNIFPIDSVDYNYKFPNKLIVKISGWQTAIPMDTYQVVALPTLSLDLASGSTDSASWRRPSLELNEYLSNQEPKFQKLWEKGRLSPDSSESGAIKDVFVNIRDEETLTNIYQLIVLSEKYLSDPKIVVFGDRFFLSQKGLPDIIIYIPADLGRVESALQSLDYLVTIKKDARVIDLSFKHPIIK